MPRPWHLVLLTALAGSACTARAPVRPAGAPAPDATAVQAYAAATRACGGLTTMTAEIALSGRAGGDSVRGRLLAGFSAPASARLEAVAPFGPPAFILAARDEVGTLLFPREHRVLEQARVADVLARLTGLALGARDIRLLLSGCLVDAAEAADGRRWNDGWRAVTLGDDRIAYLRDVAGQPRIVAADYGPWQIDYADHRNGWPRTVRVRGVDVDLTAELRQLEVNVPLTPEAFDVAVPADAVPVSLEDLERVKGGQEDREGRHDDHEGQHDDREGR